MQLQEQRLRKDLTDGFQKTIEQVRKQCEECMENRLAMQKRVFEVEVGEARFQTILGSISHSIYNIFEIARL